MVIKTTQAKELNDTELNYQEFEKQTLGKYPILKRIGECESGFRMVPNKTEASSAFGVFQILKVHNARAKKLGVSRFTREGNIKVAISLYEEQGTTPWQSSSKCWNK